jgi:hypothetical protein
MTIMDRIFRWTCLILALILLIEGAALFIGIAIGDPGNEWVNITNILFVVIDILVAAGLLRIVFRRQDLERPMLPFLLLFITIITHIYRGIEYFLPIQTRFLFTEVLFIVNGVKLGLALGALVIGLYLYFQSRDIPAT